MKKLLIPRGLWLLVPMAFFVTAFVVQGMNYPDDRMWGLIANGFIFSPITLVPYVFKLQISPSTVKRIAFSSGAQALSYFALALLAHHNHYPGRDLLMIFGLVIFAFGCIPFAAKYFFERN